MPTRTDSNEILRFAEDVGIVMERSGIPRIAGKIFALLLITQGPFLSAEEIASTLKASRASVSTMSRLLLQAGLIDKVGVTGERRTFLRVKPGASLDILRVKLSQVSVFRQYAERGLSLVKDRNSPAGQRLQELLEFYIFFEREFPLLVDRFAAQQRKLRKGA